MGEREKIGIEWMKKIKGMKRSWERGEIIRKIEEEIKKEEKRKRKKRK